MSPLLIGVVCALLGSGAAWLFGMPDRAQAKKSLEAQQAAADAQAQIAKLEAERDQREFFTQFTPKVRFTFEYPKGNSMMLEADEPFKVESIDYLTVNGASVGSQEIGQSGKSVEILIKGDYLGSAKALGPNRNDMSAPVKFRIHIQKNGMRKPHIIDAVVKVDWVQTPQAQTQVHKLMG